MSKPNGHSDARVDQLMPLSNSQALIPIHGGPTAATYRVLPSLILTKKDWQVIGERMKWAKQGKRAQR